MALFDDGKNRNVITGLLTGGFTKGAAAGGRYDTGLTPLENLAAAAPGAAGGKSSSKKLRKVTLLRQVAAANQREAQEKAEGQELQRKRDRFLSNIASGRAGRLSLLPGGGESAVAPRSLIA